MRLTCISDDRKSLTPQADIQDKAERATPRPGEEPARRTVLIYSPDLNFSFSLSLALQDRYRVVTSSNTAMLESLVCTSSADIVIVDAFPSSEVAHLIDALKGLRAGVPVILTYVYDARNVALDRSIREHVEAVLYKPFEVDSMLSEVKQLLSS